MFGLMVTEGDYQDSFIEFNAGNNDLFEDEPDGRLKFNAHLEKNSVLGEGDNKKDLMLIWELSGDTDLGDGSDSIRTILGFIPIHLDELVLIFLASKNMLATILIDLVRQYLLYLYWLKPSSVLVHCQTSAGGGRANIAPCGYCFQDLINSS